MLSYAISLWATQIVRTGESMGIASARRLISSVWGSKAFGFGTLPPAGSAGSAGILRYFSCVRGFLRGRRIPCIGALSSFGCGLWCDSSLSSVQKVLCTSTALGGPEPSRRGRMYNRAPCTQRARSAELAHCSFGDCGDASSLREQFEAPGDPRLKHASRIILVARVLQRPLTSGAVPINHILAAVGVVEVLVRIIQPLLSGRGLDVREQLFCGVRGRGIVGGAAPGARQQAVDEGARGGVEA